MHSGKLTMRQSKGCAMPVKQSLGYHLAMKIVREGEQEQRIAVGNPIQEEHQTYQSTSSSSQWDGWWTSSWWDKSWQWIENSAHDGFWQSSCDSDDSLSADIRAEGGKRPHSTHHICLPARLYHTHAMASALRGLAVAGAYTFSQRPDQRKLAMLVAEGDQRVAQGDRDARCSESRSEEIRHEARSRDV